jgi:plasmid stabilization system protein ParE
VSGRADGHIARFIEAASAPSDSAHASGNLDAANTILASNPEIGSTDIFTAATLGDAESVQLFLTDDPRNATGKGGPRAPSR